MDVNDVNAKEMDFEQDDTLHTWQSDGKKTLAGKPYKRQWMRCSAYNKPTKELGCKARYVIALICLLLTYFY